jgi:hypothetical protein
VLLHDSGGDRSRTVEALPGLIDAIRAHGYRLVTVGDLAGLTPREVMPPTERDTLELTLDRIGFGFLHTPTTCLRAPVHRGHRRWASAGCLPGVLALVHRFRFSAAADARPGTGR